MTARMSAGREHSDARPAGPEKSGVFRSHSGVSDVSSLRTIGTSTKTPQRP